MEQELKTHAIPDEMCRRAGISGRFQSTNQMAIFPSQYVKPTSKDTTSLYTCNTEAKIFQVQPHIVLFHPVIRRLLNEASGIFYMLQKTNATDLDAEEILRFSTQYRSVIRGCLQNLKEQVLHIHDGEKSDIKNYITIFYSIECIWHLCEILYLHDKKGYFIGRKLLDWVQFHVPQYECTAIRLLGENHTMIEHERDYWLTVNGCFLQGRIEEVRLLISSHSREASKPFRAAEATLKSMPTEDLLADGISISDFKIRRQHWLIDTQAKVDSHVFHDEPELLLIMQWAVGDDSAWNEARNYCDTWYSYLAAWIYYTNNAGQSYELSRFARKCMQRMSCPMKQFDATLLAVMEADVEFLKQIQNMNENGWFITHLVDLLYHAQQLDSWKSNETTSAQLRESFILEYGTLLTGHKSLWQVGLTYLDYCPVYGRAAIELLLPRLSHLKTRVTQVIREAAKRNLTEIVCSICKVQCLENIRRDNFGDALLWAIKAQDPIHITHIVLYHLEQYTSTLVMPNEELLRNLGGSIFACDSLIFLGKYFEFRRFMQDGMEREAAETLVDLMGSRFTPKFFWSVLFREAVPLLENDDIPMDMNLSLTVLSYLEDRFEEMPKMQDQVTALRVTLARNISRILISEPNN